MYTEYFSNHYINLIFEEKALKRYKFGKTPSAISETNTSLYIYKFASERQAHVSEQSFDV